MRLDKKLYRRAEELAQRTTPAGWVLKADREKQTIIITPKGEEWKWAHISFSEWGNATDVTIMTQRPTFAAVHWARGIVQAVLNKYCQQAPTLPVSKSRVNPSYTAKLKVTSHTANGQVQVDRKKPEWL